MNEFIKVAIVIFVVAAISAGIIAWVHDLAATDAAEYRKAKKIEAAYEKAGEGAVVRRINGRYIVEHSGDI